MSKKSGARIRGPQPPCTVIPPRSIYRVAMVVTRSLDIDTAISRVRILRDIRDSLGAEGIVEVYRIRTLLELSCIACWMHAVVSFIWNVFRRRAIPLQCVLYSARAEAKRLSRQIASGGFDAVYLDSVRSVSLLRALRKRAPNLRVTVDFDDLMSRRMSLLAENGWPIQLGHVRKYFPAAISRTIEGRWSRVIARFESHALRRVEEEVCKTTQAVVLISPWEAQLLRRRLSGSHADVFGMLPACRVTVNSTTLRQPVRFVFIGSDTNGQNQQSIDYLLQLWQRVNPEACLHVYGRQRRVYENIPKVILHGFVDDVCDVYTEDSILILPVFRPGGIKTKLLEAWAHARPALVNPLALEGVDVGEYPLALSEDKWNSYISEPSAYTVAWMRAAEIGNRFVMNHLCPEEISERWRQIVGVSKGRQGCHVDPSNLE